MISQIRSIQNTSTPHIEIKGVAALIPEYYQSRVREAFSGDLVAHRRLLEGVEELEPNLLPYLYVRLLPTAPLNNSTTEYIARGEISARFDEIGAELNELEQPDETGLPTVEHGAIATARDVVLHMRNTAIAPPDIGFLGSEAVVMVWIIGDTRYALTVTDGELGYVVRRRRETIRMKSGISPENFDIRRIR